MSNLKGFQPRMKGGAFFIQMNFPLFFFWQNKHFPRSSLEMVNFNSELPTLPAIGRFSPLLGPKQ